MLSHTHTHRHVAIPFKLHNMIVVIRVRARVPRDWTRARMCNARVRGCVFVAWPIRGQPYTQPRCLAQPRLVNALENAAPGTTQSLQSAHADVTSFIS